MCGLCLSLPLLATSHEFPPRPAQPRGLTKQEVVADTPHSGAERTASGSTEGCGGRLGWAFMQRAWAGPSPPLLSPPRNCPPRWKVTGKCRGNRPRARRAPASATNATSLPLRAAPTPPPRGAVQCGPGGRGQGPGDIEESWVELPPERCPGLLSDPAFPISRTCRLLFQRQKLRFREARGPIRTRRGQRVRNEKRQGLEMWLSVRSACLTCSRSCVASKPPKPAEDC